MGEFELFSRLAKYFTRDKYSMEDNYVDMPPCNNTAGLILHSCYLPEEMLTNILSFVDPDSLLRCRKVCKYWRVIIDAKVWKWKIGSEKGLPFKASVFINSVYTPLAWPSMYWICKKHPFGRNLIKNNCGQDKLKYWNIISNGGNKWAVENPPKGADTLPTSTAKNELRPDFCFATSYHSCSKQQVIDLRDEGLTAAFLDKFQPIIHVSEWNAGRFDCGSVYEMKVALLKEDKNEVVRDFEFRRSVEQWQGREWQKVSHSFNDYGPGVRYVQFFHGGMDSQFWAGHYGSKMTGAVVMVDVAVNS